MRKWICGLACAVALLIAANIFLLRRVGYYMNDIAVKEQIISDIGVNAHFMSYLESNFMWNLTSERYNLSELNLADSLGGKVSLKMMIEKPVLVYRLHETDCQECVSFGLRKLESFAASNNVKPLIIAQYSDSHLFKRWCRTTITGRMRAFNAPETLLHDKMSMPYFFILHPDLTMG